MKRDDVVPQRDMPWVATAMERWERSRRLALRGTTASPTLLRSLLENGVAVQQTVWTDDRLPAALLQVSNVHVADGAGLLDLLVDPRHADALGPELTGFLAEVFAAWPGRKLSLWACEDELTVPAYLGPQVAHRVGRLVGHDRRGPDQHADILVYEIWKDDVG